MKEFEITYNIWNNLSYLADTAHIEWFYEETFVKDVVTEKQLTELLDSIYDVNIEEFLWVKGYVALFELAIYVVQTIGFKDWQKEQWLKGLQVYTQIKNQY